MNSAKLIGDWLLKEHQDQALMQAIKRGYISYGVFRALLQQKDVVVNVRDVLIAYCHYLPLILLIGEAGADLHFDDEFLLIYALEGDHWATANYLIIDNADISVRDFLPLKIALQKGKAGIVASIMAKNVSNRIEPVLTTLHETLEQHSKDVIIPLLKTILVHAPDNDGVLVDAKVWRYIAQNDLLDLLPIALCRAKLNPHAIPQDVVTSDEKQALSPMMRALLD